ncbi:DUF2953 domain-containing protein [Paucisalibacillus sp. EB02]|uniref:DUF2953 domain-containing protein n=1 Tax=Paucisalibacillus sp. EB02 TaxID=1347087 RepID=UPI0004B25B26|nr:DUF2953 domain-containing protein [Paucisalibacillus sp. EB02]
MVWVIMIGILLFLIFILLLLQIKIRIQYRYQKDNHQVKIHVYYMKIRLIHRTIKINEYTLDESQLIELLHDYSKEDNDDNLIGILKKITNQISEFSKIFMIMIKSISIHELKWITHFGTGSASSTGTLAGGVWALKGTMIGLLFEQTEMKVQPKVSVIPHFQQKGLYSEVDCIVTIRLGNAIRTVMHLMRNINTKEEVYI